MKRKFSNEHKRESKIFRRDVKRKMIGRWITLERKLFVEAVNEYFTTSFSKEEGIARVSSNEDAVEIMGGQEIDRGTTKFSCT